MKLTHTPHRFYQFDNPKGAPYDQADTRWPTIVGKFFAPIVREKGVKAFVFLDHGDTDLELRLACRNHKAIEAKMDRLGAKLGIKRRPDTMTAGQTVGNGAFHDKRWIVPDRGKQWELARRRSELLFRFLHAGCAVYIDTLVPDGPYFRTEKNDEQPLKNLFESCLHLVANYSKAKFEVTVGLNNGNRVAHVPGMAYFAPLKQNPNGSEVAECHL